MAITIAPRESASTTTGGAREAIIPGLSWPFLVSGALTAVTASAMAVTFFVPGVLRGTAVMNGPTRGTALVALVLAVPVPRRRGWPQVRKNRWGHHSSDRRLAGAGAAAGDRNLLAAQEPEAARPA